MTERVQEQFTKLDENADGVVMPEEIRTVTFNEMDANGDGYVSKAEAKQRAREKRKNREATWLPWHEHDHERGKRRHRWKDHDEDGSDE